MIVHEYLRLLVFTHKLVTYEYFMDSLQDYELQILCDNIGWTYKNEWEIARMNSYCSLSAFGKPKKTITKMFPLITDKDDTYELKDTFITQVDIDKISSNKNKIMDLIRNGTNNN